MPGNSLTRSIAERRAAYSRASRSAALARQQDARERVLGDRLGVGARGGRDEQAALPARVGDVALDAAGGVDDRAQRRRAREQRRVERRAAPAAQDDLGALELDDPRDALQALRGRTAARAGPRRIIRTTVTRDTPPPPPRRPSAGSSPGHELEQRVAARNSREHRAPQRRPLAQPQPRGSGPPREDVHRGNVGETPQPVERLVVVHVLRRLPVTRHAGRRRSARARSRCPRSACRRGTRRRRAIAARGLARGGRDVRGTRRRGRASPAQIRTRGAPSSRALASTGVEVARAAPVRPVGRDAQARPPPSPRAPGARRPDRPARRARRRPTRCTRARPRRPPRPPRRSAARAASPSTGPG